MDTEKKLKKSKHGSPRHERCDRYLQGKNELIPRRTDPGSLYKHKVQKLCHIMIYWKYISMKSSNKIKN